MVIENGRLDAAVGGGVLRYAPESAPAALHQAGEGARLMLTALENFNYEIMRIALDKEAGGRTVIALHFRGANPDLYAGQPFEFNIPIEGYDLARMLRLGLVGYRVPEAIREKLQRFGD